MSVRPIESMLTMLLVAKKKISTLPTWQKKAATITLMVLAILVVFAGAWGLAISVRVLFVHPVIPIGILVVGTIIASIALRLYWS